MSSTRRIPKRGKPLREVFAANLKEARQKRGLSVTTLAQRTGYRGQFVRDVERGLVRGLTLGDAEALANALEIDVADLIKRNAPQ